MRRRRGLALGALVFVLALALPAPPAPAQGCPMCRTALTNSPEGRAMAASFNHAILLMLAAPYMVFGTGVAIFFRRRLAGAALRGWTRWRARRAELQPAP